MSADKKVFSAVVAAAFFTGMEGVLGEAVANCKPSTRIKDIVSRDGTWGEARLDCLSICTLVLRDGTVIVGSHTAKTALPGGNRSGRSLAYKDAIKKAKKHLKGI